MKAENVFIRAWEHGSKVPRELMEKTPSETLNLGRQIKATGSHEKFERVQLWTERGIEWDRRFSKSVAEKKAK